MSILVMLLRGLNALFIVVSVLAYPTIPLLARWQGADFALLVGMYPLFTYFVVLSIVRIVRDMEEERRQRPVPWLLDKLAGDPELDQLRRRLQAPETPDEFHRDLDAYAFQVFSLGRVCELSAHRRESA